MTTIRWLIALPLRALGTLIVIGALGAGFLDLYRSVSRDRIVLTPLGEIWYALSPETLNLLQASIQRGLHPVLWDPMMQTFLQLPGWLALFILATLTLLLAQLIYRPR
jgi:hypothetical protein